jgi:hypothetical protein
LNNKEYGVTEHHNANKQLKGVNKGIFIKNIAGLIIVVILLLKLKSLLFQTQNPGLKILVFLAVLPIRQFSL